jgi:hypothetical protein
MALRGNSTCPSNLSIVCLLIPPTHYRVIGGTVVGCPLTDLRALQHRYCVCRWGIVRYNCSAKFLDMETKFLYLCPTSAILVVLVLSLAS